MVFVLLETAAKKNGFHSSHHLLASDCIEKALGVSGVENGCLLLIMMWN